MRRILVAMSGGVDSSVAAYLLKREGWEVIGVTLDLWAGPEGAEPSARACCARAAEDARSVCRKLGLPHYTLNCRDEFRRQVVDRFCEEYLRGRTPNPCIRCNERIKFDHLLNLARELDAQAVATGHYAIVEGPDEKGRYLLRRGRDRAKEQSYVLFGLRQDQLAGCRLPLGRWEKPKARGLARELGLRTHNRPDSQEICFVPDNDYAGFLARWAPERIRPGPILDTSGRLLGRHRGIHMFTIGQRKGLGIAAGRPLYVVRIEAESATVVVGPREETLRRSFLVSDVNWIASSPAVPLEAQVKIRYTHHPSPARVEPLEGGRAARVTFLAPQGAIAPGQAAVFYRGDLVLGGGTIERVLEEPAE